MAKTRVLQQNRKKQRIEDRIPNEVEVLAALQQNVSSAFDLFYPAYQPLLYSLAFREMKNRDDANECVQTTFLRAYVHLVKMPTSRKALLKLQAWLCRILKNILDLMFYWMNVNRP